jgi:hypothetical protein
MTVRSNCEYALRQAHTSATNKYIWQDAICIDQSATQEKNHQVAMMGPIYEMAAHVLACLGPHAGDSEFLTEFIDKNRSLMRHIYSRSDKSLVSGESGWSLPNPIPENRRLSVRCFFAKEARTREHLVQSFMGRPYFSGVWVLQEMYLASRISFCCGKDERPFNDLLATSMLVDYWISMHYLVDSWDPVMRDLVEKVSETGWILRRQRVLDISATRRKHPTTSVRHGCLALASGLRASKAVRQLSEILDVMQHFECVDARDRLYGVLSLVDWYELEGGHLPVPDYNKDAFRLAVEILQIYLTNANFTPKNGRVQQWAGQLLMVSKIPRTLHDTQMEIRIRHTGVRKAGSYSAYSSSSESDLQSVSSALPQDVPSLPAHSDNANALGFEQLWYGIELLPADTGREDGHCRSRYLP